MADDATIGLEEPEKNPPDEVPARPAPHKAGLRRWLTPKWLGLLLGLSLVLHAAGYTFYRLRGQLAAEPAAEISLGEFRFEAERSDPGQVTRADFALYVALLSEIDATARQRLGRRKYRVQQDVEELLRRAHSADFQDPALGELKRQLQERINETLGVRAIAEVIVTDLRLERDSRPVEALSGGDDAVPWADEPST